MLRTGPNTYASSFESVSRETQERLRVYVNLLSRWNQTVNLVSQRDVPNLWARHIGDSLTLATLISEGTVHGIDLGSGAGFPGLVISIVTGIRFTLVESDHRKAAFLLEAARLTKANAEIVCDRIEALTPTRYPLVVARGLAPLRVLLAYANVLLTPNGIGLFPKGTKARAELLDAQREWLFRVEQYPGTQQNACILRVSDIARA